MKIDREKHPHLTEEEISELVNGLKEMEKEIFILCLSKRKSAPSSTTLQDTAESIREGLAELDSDVESLRHDVERFLRKLEPKQPKKKDD